MRKYVNFGSGNDLTVLEYQIEVEIKNKFFSVSKEITIASWRDGFIASSRSCHHRATVEELVEGLMNVVSELCLSRNVSIIREGDVCWKEGLTYKLSEEHETLPNILFRKV